MKKKTKRKYNRKVKSAAERGTKLHNMQAAAYSSCFPELKDEEVADALRAHAERKEWGDQQYKAGYDTAKNELSVQRAEAAIRLMSAVGQTIQAMASVFGEMPSR